MFVSASKSYFYHKQANSFEVLEERHISGWHGKWSGAVRPTFINNEYNLIESID
jgi:hypothetical protein